MATTEEKLHMIQETFNKGLEVLGIIREQLLKKNKDEKESSSEYRIYDVSQVDQNGCMTLSFAGFRLFVKVRIAFRSQRGYNQYAGFIDWGMFAEDAQGENVRATNEYKWTEDRIFLVETVGERAESHLIRDQGKVYDFSGSIHNNIYSCLPESLKSKALE